MPPARGELLGRVAGLDQVGPHRVVDDELGPAGQVGEAPRPARCRPRSAPTLDRLARRLQGRHPGHDGRDREPADDDQPGLAATAPADRPSAATAASAAAGSTTAPSGSATRTSEPRTSGAAAAATTVASSATASGRSQPHPQPGDAGADRGDREHPVQRPEVGDHRRPAAGQPSPRPRARPGRHRRPVQRRPRPRRAAGPNRPSEPDHTSIANSGTSASSTSGDVATDSAR